MGHRSWITVVDGDYTADFFELLVQRSNGNYCDNLDYEVWLSYVYKVTKPFGGYGEGRVIIAWNSDSSGVLDAIGTNIQLDTILLDNSVMCCWGEKEFAEHGVFLPDADAVREAVAKWL